MEFSIPSFGLPSLGSNKLRIWAYDNEALSGLPIDMFEVMYNPETVDLGHMSDYSLSKEIGSENQQGQYNGAKPANLRLSFVLDSSLFGNSEPVDDMVSRLRTMLHQPLTIKSSGGAPDRVETPFLKITWGSFNWHEHNYFAGRAVSTNAQYSVFGAQGKPCRAQVKMVVEASNTLKIQSPSTMGLLSLALITASDAKNLAMEIAGMALEVIEMAALAIDYLSVAYDNDLDNLDDYEAGDSLVGQSPGVGPGEGGS